MTRRGIDPPRDPAQAARFAAGQCVRCGKRPPVAPRRTCDPCATDVALRKRTSVNLRRRRKQMEDPATTDARRRAGVGVFTTLGRSK